MLQRFLMKKMMKRQLKDMPEDQQEKLMAMVEKNPDLFTNIAKEIQEKVKKDKMDQMSASMVVMQKYQKELQEAMKGIDQ